MEGRPRKVVRYQTDRGTEPYTLWFERQLEWRGRIAARITRIEETGNFGDFKPVGDGVFELRFIGKVPAFRIYFANDLEEDQIVLLTGGTKDGQDTDIASAKRYWEDYNA